MTPTQPVLLDLVSGGGGAAKGYMDAGFVVIGIDSISLISSTETPVVSAPLT